MRTVILAAAGALALSSPALADRTFSDGVFNPANWGFETFTIGDGGSAQDAQIATGGNPDQARRITTDVSPAAGSTVYAVSRFGTTQPTRYVPSVDGAIATVDFSIDFRSESAPPLPGHSIFLAAKQGVVVYIAGGTIAGSPAWSNYSITGVTAADFTPLGSATPIDFSATGQPIRFGFACASFSLGTEFVSVGDYDNFVVSTHSVPAPGVGVLLAAGAVLSRRRRR